VASSEKDDSQSVYWKRALTVDVNTLTLLLDIAPASNDYFRLIQDIIKAHPEWNVIDDLSSKYQDEQPRKTINKCMTTQFAALPRKDAIEPRAEFIKRGADLIHAHLWSSSSARTADVLQQAYSGILDSHGRQNTLWKRMIGAKCVSGHELVDELHGELQKRTHARKGSEETGAFPHSCSRRDCRRERSYRKGWPGGL
jgi:hypothetical protein